MQDYYTKLGVDRNANLDEIKKAYLKQLKKYHPDVYNGDPNYAQQKTAELNVIYETLKDKSKRDKYNIETFGPPVQESAKQDDSIDDNLFKQMLVRLRKGMSANSKAKQAQKSAPKTQNKSHTQNAANKEKPKSTKQAEKRQPTSTQNAIVKKEKQEVVLTEEQKEKEEKKKLLILISAVLGVIFLIVLLFLIL